MTNPGLPGEDERPLAGPDTGMGLPESGTQDASSTDFELMDGPAESATDPLLITPPPARPAPPAYDEAAYDQPTYDQPDYDGPGDEGGAGGLLEKVKAFAGERPAVFLAAALVAGWFVGKLLGSSDDDDDSADEDGGG